MAKKSIIQRNLKRIRLIKKYAVKRELTKQLLKGSNSYQAKLKISMLLQNLPRNSAPCRHRNRCWLTGRARAFSKDFGVSRHVLREMAHEGNIPGLRKS